MFSLAKLAEEVRKLAAEYPDNVYGDKFGGCLYTAGKNTVCPNEGCIIGIALRRCGIPFSFLDEMDNLSGDGYNTSAKTVLSKLIETHHISCSENEWDLMPWFERVQQRQDSFISWGVAVSKTDKEQE